MCLINLTPYKQEAIRVGKILDINPQIIFAQWYHESGGFKSSLARNHNNLGGLTQTKPNGNKQPDGGNYYMDFRNLNEFGDAYVKFLSGRHRGARGAKTPEQFANALKKSGYYGDSLQRYTKALKGHMKMWGGKPTFSFNALGELPSYQNDMSPMFPKEDIQNPSFVKQTKDVFVNEVLQSPIVGTVRTAVINAGQPFLDDPNWTPSEKDFKTLQELLPNDSSAQLYVAMNSSSPESFNRLIQMKIKDKQREEEISKYGLGAKIVGTIAGMAVDPINYIPLGQEAAIGRVLGRLGKTGLSVSKMTRLAAETVELGVTNAGLNVANAYLAEQQTGYKQNYLGAALLGGTLAPTLHGTGHFFKGRTAAKGAQRVLDKLDDVETNTILHAADLHIPAQIKEGKTKAIVAELHDAKYNDVFNPKEKPEIVKSILGNEKAKDHQVFVLDREQAKTLASQLGFKAPKGKSFHVPSENYTVLIKDKVGHGINGSAESYGLDISLKDTDKAVAQAILPHQDIKGLVGERAARVMIGDLDEFDKLKPHEKISKLKDVQEKIDTYLDTGKALGNKEKDIKTIRKAIRNTLNNVGLSDMKSEEVKGVLHEAINNSIENVQGYRVLEDGTCVWKGWKFSEGSVLSPANISNLLEVDPSLEKFYGGGDFLETSTLTGDYRGICANSASKSAREWAEAAYIDSRMRPQTQAGVIPKELYKKSIQDKLFNKYNEAHKLREEYLYKFLKNSKGQKLSIDDFNMQAIDCLNSKFNEDRIPSRFNNDWNEGVEQFAAIIDDIRKDEIKFGKTNRSGLGLKGKNLLPDNYSPLTNEFFRQHDSWKLLELKNKFNSEEDFRAFLTDYGSKAADRKAIEELLKRQSTGADLDNLDNQIDDFIKEGARDWALGMTDKGVHSEGRDMTAHDFFRERFPMNTGLTVQMHDGSLFSFDSNLRSYDLDQIMQTNINRFSGELAVRTYTDDINSLVKKIESELDVAVRDKKISRAQANKEQKAFERSLARMRGTARDDLISSGYEVITNALRKVSYGKNSGSFGANQLGEAGGAVGYCGLESVMSCVPILGDIIGAATKGRVNTKFLKDTQQYLFGESIEKLMLEVPFPKRNVKDMLADGQDKFGILQKIDTGSDLYARLGSQLNMMPKLTDAMLAGAQRSTVWDSLMWATGKNFSALRNPFSYKKLRALGIGENMANKIKHNLVRYSNRDAKGNFTKLDVDRWQKEEPISFAKWYYMVDMQTRRAYQQTSIGGTNYLKDTNAFTQFAFQFKDFALRTINGQFMRVWTNRELDDCMATLFSMGTNAMVYSGLTYAKACAYFPNDDFKKQQYLKDRLSLGKIAAAGVLRAGIFSGASLGSDIYEAATGAQSFRTTVDRTSSYGQPKDAGDFAGNLVNQVPSVKTATDLASVITKPARMLLNDDEQFTKRDWDKLTSFCPIGNAPPIVYLRNIIGDELDLPEK